MHHGGARCPAGARQPVSPVALDEEVAPLEYNYRPAEAAGEHPGLSVLFRLGDEVMHTYSAFVRGVEGWTDAYSHG